MGTPPNRFYLYYRPMTLFKKYVEIGRVCRVTKGPNVNKMVVIVDIIDQNRVMVNGADVQRQQMHFTELALTPIVGWRDSWCDHQDRQEGVRQGRHPGQV